jgi:hypothetical protein
MRGRWKSCIPYASNQESATNQNQPGGESSSCFCVQMFSVKTSDGVVATSFKKDDKVDHP